MVDEDIIKNNSSKLREKINDYKNQSLGGYEGFFTSNSVKKACNLTPSKNSERTVSTLKICQLTKLKFDYRHGSCE